MYSKIYTLFILFIFIGSTLLAQSSSIKGKVVSRVNSEAIPFVPVVIQGGTAGAVTDDNGEFIIQNVDPGLYNLECQAVGFKKAVLFEVEVSLDRPAIVQILLDELSVETGTVEIVHPEYPMPKNPRFQYELLGLTK